jgi:hypothetical protein
MHGGAIGSGAPSGKRNGMYRHGRYTAQAIAERRAVRALALVLLLGARMATIEPSLL